MRRHRFQELGVLTEPGISDVHAGRWSRRLVVCERCGEQRKVWIGLDTADIEDRCPRWWAFWCRGTIDD